MTAKSYFRPIYHDFPVFYQYWRSPISLLNEASSLVLNSTNSPVVNGRLVLQNNTLDMERQSFKTTPALGISYDVNGLLYQKPVLTFFQPRPYGYSANLLISDLLNETTLAFYAKCKDLRVNILQSFAERQQTINMVSRTARSLATAYTDIRRGKIPKLFSHLGKVKSLGKSAPNAWLEYKYGWKPLLSDIVGALKVSYGRMPKSIVSVTRRSSQTFANDLNHGFSSEGPKLTKQSWGVKSRVCIQAEVTWHTGVLGDANGLGIDNPLLLAWELLPYSFVVDWFYNIGGFLEATSGLSGFTLGWSSTTCTVETAYEGKLVEVFIPVGDRKVTVPGSCIGHEKWKKRTLGLLSPTDLKPVLNFKTLDTSKFISSIALLAQAFRR